MEGHGHQDIGGDWVGLKVFLKEMAQWLGQSLEIAVLEMVQRLPGQSLEEEKGADAINGRRARPAALAQAASLQRQAAEPAVGLGEAW
jgi:hypothetical protein